MSDLRIFLIGLFVLIFGWFTTSTYFEVRWLSAELRKHIAEQKKKE